MFLPHSAKGREKTRQRELRRKGDIYVTWTMTDGDDRRSPPSRHDDPSEGGTEGETDFRSTLSFPTKSTAGNPKTGVVFV